MERYPHYIPPLAGGSEGPERKADQMAAVQCGRGPSQEKSGDLPMLADLTLQNPEQAQRRFLGLGSRADPGKLQETSQKRTRVAKEILGPTDRDVS